MVTVSFFLLSDFNIGESARVDRTDSFPTATGALEAVKAFASKEKFADVQVHSTDDGWSLRYTANTPDGRRRMVACAQVSDDGP